MKANEAPERIYIFENQILDFTKLSVKQNDNDIEYTRSDAFFEKAEEFLYEKLNSGDMECGDIERFVENMKIYMKGE